MPELTLASAAARAQGRAHPPAGIPQRGAGNDPDRAMSPLGAKLLADLHLEVLGALDSLGALGDGAAHNLCIERAVLGVFFTGVKLSNGVGGLCATPLKSIPSAVCCPSSALAMPLPGKLAGRSALQLLDDLYRPQDLRRALAIATLNALAETVWQHSGPPAGWEVRSGDAFDALQIAPQHQVVLVGAFAPYLRELRRRAQPFRVLELDMSTLKAEELLFHVTPEQAPRVLAQADVFIATGTTLINGTLDGLLDWLRPGVQAAVVGPTATLVPGPFARRGATLVGGTRVTHPDALLDMLAEGGSGYHFFGKSVQRVTLCRPGAHRAQGGGAESRVVL